MELEFLPCPTCRDITPVEVPPCAHTHDDGCPERACTVCGTGLTFSSGSTGSTSDVADATMRKRPGGLAKISVRSAA